MKAVQKGGDWCFYESSGRRKRELSEMELSAAEKGAVISANVTRCFENQSPATHSPPRARDAAASPSAMFGPASLCLQEGKVIFSCRPGEPNVSFCIPGMQINQRCTQRWLPCPEICLSALLCIPESNFLQEPILITLFKQRGFGVQTNVTFGSATCRIFFFLSFQFKETMALAASS